MDSEKKKKVYAKMSNDDIKIACNSVVPSNFADNEIIDILETIW